MRDRRVLSRNKPSKPSSMKRCCQRQTQVLDLPISRMIALVPTPSAESRTIWARQTFFWAELRSAIRARRRRRTVDETVREIPLRMLQTRMRQRAEESLSGFKCQILSTRMPKMHGPNVLGALSAGAAGVSISLPLNVRDVSTQRPSL